MSRVCQVTGASPQFGNNRPWSRTITKRRFDVNVQRKKYWVPSLGRHVTLTLSARGVKTVDQRGIERVVADILARGGKV